MGLFSRKREAGVVEDRSLTRASAWPWYPVLQQGDIAPSTAMQIPDVFSCVRCLADSAASVPLVAYRRLPNGDRERSSGRLSDLIAHPAPAMSTANLIATTVAHMNLYGNCYIGKYRGPDGIVEQIAPLLPTQVQTSLDQGEPIYTYVSQDGVQKLGTSDVLHIKMLSTDGIIGLSPIQQVRNALGLAQNLAQHANAFAQNAGRPGGILRVGGWRSAQQGAQRTFAPTGRTRSPEVSRVDGCSC